jgi:hypothetical protein
MLRIWLQAGVTRAADDNRNPPRAIPRVLEPRKNARFAKELSQDSFAILAFFRGKQIF